MPKIKCDCGNIIGLGEIPNPNQSLIISDVEFDTYFDKTGMEIYDKMKIVVHCSVCQRLYIYWNGFNEIPTIYMKQ